MSNGTPEHNEYLATRHMESKKALEWVGAYTSNPELAATLLPLFNMPEEDSRFIIRTINSLYDTLFFYKMAIQKSNSKKKANPNTKKVIVGTM